MVIRGKPRGNGKQLGDYLLKADNDNVQVFDIRGTSQPKDLRKSLLEMSFTSELTKSEKGLYHAQINPAYGEDRKMTRKDWLKAVTILEDELKLSGQKRVIVMHEKKGRIHAHVVWERYNHDTGKIISDSYSRLAQDRSRIRIEQELEQKRTPQRNPRQPEMKLVLTEMWNKFKDAAMFMGAAIAKGYIISSGTQRPYMVIDETGRSFDLVRQLQGIKTKEVKERFKDTKLPTEKQAITQARNTLNQKAFDNIQDSATEKLAAFKKQQTGKGEQNRFESKLSMMQDNGVSISVERADKTITSSQDKMLEELKAFKERQAKRQKLLKQYTEQFSKNGFTQRKPGRGLEL